MSRSREFDTEAALDAAMLVFWRLGYERATLAELTKAMGINRPSLYAAYGNKEELFRRALDRYLDGPWSYEQQVIALPTAREVAVAMLRGAADGQTGHDTPHGCMIVFGATSNATIESPIGRALIEARCAGEAALLDRLERARDEGDLPPSADPRELAGFVRAVIYGLSVKAASGSTREELERVIEVAMRAWPE
jgi:AcrR family transcriptional regulator